MGPKSDLNLTEQKSSEVASGDDNNKTEVKKWQNH